MEALIIQKLETIKDPVAESLVNLAKGKVANVEDSYYESTVFENKSNYAQGVNMISQSIAKYFFKNLVKTPLTFVKGKFNGVWNSVPGQEFAIGTTLIHYITKDPLLLIMVTKTDEGYQYESLKLNLTSKEYESLTRVVLKNKLVHTLADAIGDAVKNDIETFEEK